MFPTDFFSTRTAKLLIRGVLVASLPAFAAAQSSPVSTPGPNPESAVAQPASTDDPGQSPADAQTTPTAPPTPTAPQGPGSTKAPLPPRTNAGVAPPPPGIPLTAGVSTTPLPYRPGDVAAATGTQSESEKIMGYLPHWIRFDGELRDRVEGYENLNFKPFNSDLYDLYRLDLGMLIQPISWVRFYIQTGDQRVFERSPAIPPYEDTWDIKKAFIELGDPEGSGFGLRVGRQELFFGNGRLIGNSWWSNVSRSFDAVRGSYDKNGYRLDLFIASVVIEREGVITHHNEGNNLSGAYGTLKNKVARNSQLEPYTFWHVQQGASLKGGGLGHLDEWTFGFRFLGNLPGNLDYRTEMAVQRGTLGPASIKAWTGHWLIGDTLPVYWKPRPFIEYNYASGDPNSKNLAQIQTFDPIYPSTHDKLGLADQIGWRNIRDLRGAVDLHPAKKWALNTSFHNFNLANAHDALYPARGSVVAKDYAGVDGTHIGEEFDAQAIYKPTLQTQIGAGVGHLIAGQFLKDTTKGQNYTYPYFLVDYVF